MSDFTEIFGRIKSFACRYPLYFRRENVEVASIDLIFTGLLVASLVSIASSASTIYVSISEFQ